MTFLQSHFRTFHSLATAPGDNAVAAVAENGEACRNRNIAVEEADVQNAA
jgi:hypothetical protein